jgi:hypothetical protein
MTADAAATASASDASGTIAIMSSSSDTPAQAAAVEIVDGQVAGFDLAQDRGAGAGLPCIRAPCAATRNSGASRTSAAIGTAAASCCSRRAAFPGVCRGARPGHLPRSRTTACCVIADRKAEIVVIGGGFIGSEIAAALDQRLSRDHGVSGHGDRRAHLSAGARRF